jgi:hypothetical protein
MDILQESKDTKKGFFSHVFSTAEESKAEILNVVQYAFLGIIPVVILNKLIQRFIPDADGDKSSLELLAEIFIQITVMFCGIILIHRMITYIPTYSGFKYENLILTNVILAFLILVLSIQTKLGIKVNILADRISELWNGNSDQKVNVRQRVRVNDPMSGHHSSQADYLDNHAADMFPPAPIATSRPPVETHDTMMRGSGGGAPAVHAPPMDFGPMAANSLLGSSFGSF